MAKIDFGRVRAIVQQRYNAKMQKSNAAVHEQYMKEAEKTVQEADVTALRNFVLQVHLRQHQKQVAYTHDSRDRLARILAGYDPDEHTKAAPCAAGVSLELPDFCKIHREYTEKLNTQYAELMEAIDAAELQAALGDSKAGETLMELINKF